MLSAPTLDDLTPMPFLEELSVAGSEAGWQRFVYLYEPFLRAQLRRYGLQDCDESDLTQEVFTVVLRKLADFRHNGNPGAFRAWLRAIVAHTARNFFGRRRRRPATRLGAWADELADDHSALVEEWDREHDHRVSGRLLELARAEFDELHYQAFVRTALDGQPAASVAAALGVSRNVVYIARSRVLTRLRALGRGLMPAS